MKIQDTNKVPELLKVLEDLRRTHIEIGIFGDDDSELVMIGTVHEFGLNIKVTDKMRNYLRIMGLPLKNDTRSINIPERSFIRSSYDHNKNKIINFERELGRVIALDLPVDTFFELVGEWAVGAIQRYMTENVKTPPLAPFTIARKGSSNPLIDTGRLRQSIRYKIVRE